MDFKDGQINCQQSGHEQGWEILRHLGHRPSDVLQANGIIWVEGPSDKVYLQTWLDLYAASRSSVDGSGPIRWGLDAEILWYGGTLLAHVGAGQNRFWGIATDADCKRLLNVASVNGNGAIVMDRDAKRGKKWATKLRVKKECEERGMLVWITSEREIECYRSNRYQNSWQDWEGKVKAADDYRAAVLQRGEPLERVVADGTDVVSRISELYDRLRSWGRANGRGAPREPGFGKE